MLAQSIGQMPPLFPAKAKSPEEPRFAAADGMVRIEEIVFYLVLRNDGFLGMRQFHFVARAGAQGMSRFTRKVLSPPGGAGNRDWRGPNDAANQGPELEWCAG